MAWTIDDAFRGFHTAINLSGDNRAAANTRKDWVVGRLAGKMTVVDAFTFGSIPRFTALKDHADADVLVVLHYGQHINGRQPATVLNNVKTALGSIGTVRRNGQAITVKFNSWPDLDVVPAARYGNSDGTVAYYEIPDSVRGVWIQTKPRLHAKQVEDAASTRGPVFRQVIKMAKDWNRRQTPRLQSYHIEVIALKSVPANGDYAWSMYKWFDEAQNAIGFYWHEGQDVSQYISWSDASRLKTLLVNTTSTARSAWSAGYGSSPNPKTAITRWKSIFGQRFPGYG
jgi:Second Messenger Oligonucleotide or Dinucleotide Synthetase domain